MIRGNARPPDPYLQRLAADNPIMKFYDYGRNFPSPVNPGNTEIQAFRYIGNIVDRQGLDSLVHIPPKYLKFEHATAELYIEVFSRLSYYELSESLRTLGVFHLRFGYFEKSFILRLPNGRILCEGKMNIIRPGVSSE